MTDRGEFCWLTIIVLLITGMTFTGKPLQSYYLLMLNSATLQLHSLSPSLLQYKALQTLLTRQHNVQHECPVRAAFFTWFYSDPTVQALVLLLMAEMQL